MALGKLLTRPRPQRDGDLARAAGAGFQVIIDGHPVNWPMSLYRGGMSLPGAWRAALMISDTLGSIPWDAYVEDDDAMPVEKITPRPLLLEQPAPPDNAMTTFSSLALDLIWHGNAVGIWADRDRDRIPTAVLPIPAEQMGARRVGREAISALPVGAIEYQTAGFSFGVDEIMHIKGPCPPSEVRGFGVLEAHLTGRSGVSASTLDLARELQRQAQSVSEHGVPTGVLQSKNPEASAESLQEAKAEWLRSQASRTIAALNASVEFEPIAWNPTELQLIEARKMSLLEQALVFGVQPSFLGVETSNRTYRNDNAEDVKFARWGLRGHIGRFEATLSAAMPRGVCVRANLDAVTMADMLTRFQAFEIGARARVLLPNEARAMDGRRPIPGGDEFPELTLATPMNESEEDDNDDDSGQEDG